VACLGGVGLVVSACGGPLQVDTPRLSGQAARTCSALVHALPATVDSGRRRAVETSGAPASAAWGDPAIVLRCGVPMPRQFDRFATCQEANGVGWFIPQAQMTGSPESITMTTIGRAVNVEVSLPRDYWPPAAAMVDLAPAIKKTVPETHPCV
jgi:hypothetical protein